MKTGHVYIIAGPNGSGKTTFAKQFLADYVHCPQFVNADLIAQGLSPLAPHHAAVKAGKLVLEQIREFTDRRIDFAFESTLSGKAHTRWFQRFKRQGYRIHLFFLWIPNAQLALERIKDRVADGGHDVPTQDVQRRFQRSLSNFKTLYRPLVDSWMMFDNSGLKPQLIAKERAGHLTIILKSRFLEIFEQ